MRLITLLKTLPGVKPLAAKRVIYDDPVEEMTNHIWEGQESDWVTIDLQKDSEQKSSDWMEANLWRNEGATSQALDVSCEGAKQIIDWYRQGRLPMKGQVGVVPEWLNRLVVEGRIGAEERTRDRVSDKPLESISEDAFSYHNLNDIFARHNKLREGESTLTIGGIEVRKTVLGFKSNSGKSKDYAVRFNWTGSDGVQRQCEKDSFHAGNRRHDETRNWGLGRE